MDILYRVLKPFRYILMALLTLLSGIFPYGFSVTRGYARFEIDPACASGTAQNVVSNINCWEMGKNYYSPRANEKYNVFDFVEYVQLMQCSGGNETRDLFVDPLDRSVLDDYDFECLIENCRGIVSLGAKPHLKLGSVPLKFTSNPQKGGFDTNICPPDDYDVYYDYIRAIANALLDEFGREELLTWRFGVMTEFENGDWFMSPGGDERESCEAYCKLYDYTVQALIDTIGDVFVGAHSMTVTKGLWDPADFIRHVASGINYKTGQKGTRICFLSASFYDQTPGRYTSGYTLPETIAYLRENAEKCGLNDLIYGIDEGRILCGLTSGKDDDQLNSRTVGYTWQGAYDARLWRQCLLNGIDYFSSWSFLSGGVLDGYPTVSYHVARLVSEFAGSELVKTKKSAFRMADFGAETDAVSVYDAQTHTLRIMAYNFKNSLNYDRKAALDFNIDVSSLGFTSAHVTVSRVDDSSNYFDEWCSDREELGITDDCFAWSPDDPTLESRIVLSDEKAIELYKNTLRDKYEECAQLTCEILDAPVSEGVLSVKDEIAPNSAVFYEIQFG